MTETQHCYPEGADH